MRFFLVLTLIFSLSIVLAAKVCAAKKAKSSSSVVLAELVSGLDGIFAYNDSTIDMAKNNTLTIWVKSFGLRDANSRLNHFKVEAYTLDAENNKDMFAAISSKVLRRRNRASKLFIPFGEVEESGIKEIYFDIYDVVNNLVATYKVEINLTNVEEQQLFPAEILDADCDNTTFGECQLDYFFSRVSFDTASPFRQSPIVYKRGDGRYSVSIPAPRARVGASTAIDSGNNIPTANSVFNFLQFSESSHALDSNGSTINEDGKLIFNGSRLVLDVDGEKKDLAFLSESGGGSASSSLVQNSTTIVNESDWTKTDDKLVYSTDSSIVSFNKFDDAVSYRNSVFHLDRPDPLPANQGMFVFEVNGSAMVNSFLTYSDTSSYESTFNMAHVGGSQAAPATSSNGFELGTVNFGGYSSASSDVEIGASILGSIDSEWASSGDSTDNPAGIIFQTVPDGSDTLVSRMTIRSSGNVGIGTVSPASTLQVSGGYFQLPNTSGAPAAGDCDEAAELGRMVVHDSANTLYICASSGWRTVPI